MSIQLSEQRARTVTRELLTFRGWDLRPVSSGGQLLEESEYRAYPPLLEIFKHKSKSGPGIGKPDFLLVDSPASLNPILVIDTKPRVADIQKSITDTKHYADAIHDHGRSALAVAVAGAERELYEVSVQRRVNGSWRELTLHKTPIDWIPSPQQTQKVLSTVGLTEVAPERPSDKVLAEQANRLNEILRECNIKDGHRPIYAATFMLGLWYGEVSPDPKLVLEQINANAKAALKEAQKSDLAQSLSVNTENEELASLAWHIIDILKKLNIRSFLYEHDYLGQLYETFFRYTGGNTIGQYFTPRHIVDFMCDLVQITPEDTVFDPACGTGGFLIGAIKRMIRLENLDYREAIAKVRHNVFGLESEPTTAALCVTNMILRGDGKSGVLRANCFKKPEYPKQQCDFALMNPPFPHKKKKTQKPASAFIDRALQSVKHKGVLAAIVPYSLLANVKDWHHQLLKRNRLVFASTMPADLFNPYSNYDTAVLVIQKGVPHEGGRVFFARMDNDGYRLKKAMRVPRQGSQISELLEAYDKKSEIPEFTAYRSVTSSTAEWSPETFIESAPHDDTRFTMGLEEHIRKQASFYIRHGFRLIGPGISVQPTGERVFSNDSTVSFENVHQGKFRVGDFFTVALGGKDEIEDLEDGSDPFVSTSEWDNGVSSWKSANVLYPAPAITVATDGSAYTSYVQEFPFYAFYKVAILRPIRKSEVPPDALYYVSYLLQREKWRFVRARKYGKARIENTLLSGPMKNRKPDFERMAELIRTCAAFPIIQAFKEGAQRSIRDRFAELVSRWKAAQGNASSVSRMTAHPAYKDIVRMGEAAVPLLLSELRREPDHWFPALQAITGENPVPKEKWGKLRQMAEMWIQWGKARGYSR